MKTDDSRLRIGIKLKDAREYLGISQEEAAKVADISRSAISLIESGQRKLDAVELMELAKLYQRPMAYFTDDSYTLTPEEEASFLARNIKKLSENDRKELIKFAEFLASKSQGSDNVR